MPPSRSKYPSDKKSGPLRILILEDHFTIRQDLVSLVEQMGHIAAAVTTAEEGIELLEQTAMDAVISDVFIKKDGAFVAGGGVKLIGAIRFPKPHALKIARKAPILVISGGLEIEGGYSPLRTARGIGADFCLRKPLDMDEVAVWILDAEVAVRTLAANRKSARRRPALPADRLRQPGGDGGKVEE